MTKTAKIREIFKSIQGEGPYVGTLQVFVRFCTCNLDCRYCDTDFELSKSKDYTPDELMNEIEQMNLPHALTISLTGGEPLMSADFLTEFLPLAKAKDYKIYLETNATLPDKLLRVLDYIDIVAADIKLESSTGMKPAPAMLERFFEISSSKKTFAKIVFDKNITDNEIDFSIMLAKKYGFEIILQPVMFGDNMGITNGFCEEIFDKFYSKYPLIRLIPQVHKYLNVR